MPAKHCCCKRGCDGCCFPFHYFDFPPLGRNLDILRWEIDAPNCDSCGSGGIDGCTGEFSPETTGPHDQFGPCGNCICYQNDSGELFLIGAVYFDNGGVCSETSCQFNLCFGLTCDVANKQFTAPGVEKCCSGIKLLAMLRFYDDVAGGKELDLRGECFDELSPGGLPQWPGCIPQGNELYRYLDPISCTCEDSGVYPPQEFELVYNLEELAPVCGQTFPLGHPCAGLLSCCRLANPYCFDDATIIVTKKP